MKEDTPIFLVVFVRAGDHINAFNEVGIFIINTKRKTEAANDALPGDVLEHTWDAETGGIRVDWSIVGSTRSSGGSGGSRHVLID